MRAKAPLSNLIVENNKKVHTIKGVEQVVCPSYCENLTQVRASERLFMYIARHLIA